MQIHQRRTHLRRRRGIEPVLERETDPGEVAAAGVVEGEGERVGDRKQQEDEGQNCVDTDGVAARPITRFRTLPTVVAPGSQSGQQRSRNRSGSCPGPPFDLAHVHQHEHQDAGHRDERQHRRRRVVVGLGTRSRCGCRSCWSSEVAQQRSVHVVTCCRDESQQRAGDDARHRQRPGDLAETR